MGEQDRYRERVRNAFEKFLVSNFIEYKPYSVNDVCIIEDAKDRSVVNYDGGLLQWMQSFASIVTIEGAKDMEYNGNNFKQLLLKAKDGNLIRINYSDFEYYTSLYKGKEDSARFGYDYDESNAHYVSLLDTQRVSPDSLASKIGSPILMGYNFNTVNRFGKLRSCHRLYSLSGDNALDAEKIRGQILRAQAFALLMAAKYPVLCLPSYNHESLSPYMYDITKEIGTQFAPQLRAKLHAIELALKEKCLSYEYNI